MSERRRQPRMQGLSARKSPPRYNAIVASSSIMGARPAGLRGRLVKTDAWQEDAWRLYDESGELRFAAGWIASGLSRVNLRVATVPESLGDDPAPVTGTGSTPIETDAVGLVSAIAGGPKGQAALLSRLGTLLTIVGVGWILIEATTTKGKGKHGPDESWSWRALSNDEVRDNGEVEVEDLATGEWRALGSDHVLIKVWRSHARHASKPDSSTRGAIRPLRQLSKLDDHVDATADSRLAGAGLLILPNEVEFTPIHGADDPDDPDDDTAPTVDDFVEVLMDTMTTPISDRGVAGAVVPLAIRVPGEYVDKVKHITFWSEFSDAVLGLGERAIKRFALAMDMPPEIITGVSDMNHWGAWRVQEEAITLHIDPLASVIDEALTTDYLRPGLLGLGHAQADVDRLLVHHDTTNLTVRPDLSDDTIAAWDRIEASSEVLRREIGLSDTDKPSDEERRQRIIMRVIDRSPQLAPYLLPELGINVDIPADALGGGSQPFPQTTDQQTTTPDPQMGGTPDGASTASAASADSHLSADAGLLAACDGIIHRAFEIGGRRLHNRASRKDGGTSIECGDPTTIHTRFDATTFATVHELLDGAWSRVPVIADRYGLDPDSLLVALDSYARGLLVNGLPHTVERLHNALKMAPAAVR